jgi:hypothetical protein
VPGPRKYTCAPELTSSRLPTIHLSKSRVFLRRRTPSGSTPQPLPTPYRPVRGGGILSFIPPLSIGSPEDFCATFRGGRKDSNASDLRRKLGSEQLSKGVANCNGRPGSKFAAVQSTTADPNRVVGTKPNQLSGGIIYPPSLACQPLGGRFHSRRVDVSTLR